MIPKIIHYCWLSNDPIPEEFQKYIESWKRHLIGYEFKLWTFDIFDKGSSLWVSQAFDAKKYAFATDFIRLYAVYHYGGIYMDMDIEVLKSFDDLLDRDLFFGYESPTLQWLEAGCFGTTKENSFIGECLKYYDNRPFIKEDGNYDMLPLPQIITPIYKKIVKIEPFSFDYFTAKSLQTGEITTTKNTYTIHHFAASWREDRWIKLRDFKYKLHRKHMPNFLKAILCNAYYNILSFQHHGVKGSLRKVVNKIKSK